MGIRLDRARAMSILAAAIEWARSEQPVPEKWLVRTQEIAGSDYITLTPAFGTALLAKATDRRVDALSLKVESGPDAYSARSLAHGVLVPAAFEYGFDLRTTGAEPLNNQPFFRYDRLDQMDRVRDPAAHRQLVAYLREANTLDERDAFLALAAFLRDRLRAAGATEALQLRGSGASDIAATIRAVDTYIHESAEGGKRVQALTAAVFDLVYDEVRTTRVNDPSRHAPGDVQGLYNGEVIAAAEARAKAVTLASASQFIRKVADAGIPHAVIAALAPGQQPLLRPSLALPWRERNVIVTVAESAEELMVAALSWNDRPVPLLLESFPEYLLRRLHDLEARPESVRRWVHICEEAGLALPDPTEPAL